MMLTAGQRAALLNLAAKKSGQDVGWISIADARSLTDLGFAVRVSSGWAITAAGEALLSDAEGSKPKTDFELHRRF